jgi:hypothetical protein
MKNVAMSITFLMLFCCTFYSSAMAKDFRADEIGFAAFLISTYGKDKVGNLIQSERNGHITLIIENELIDASGRPNTDYVTPYTVCIDVNKIGWNLLEFKDKVCENSSKPKAKVRRFTESSIPKGNVEIMSFSSEKPSAHAQFQDDGSSIKSNEQLQEIDRQIDSLREIAERARTPREATTPEGTKVVFRDMKCAIQAEKAAADLLIRKARLEAEMRNPQDAGLKMRNQQDERESEIMNQQYEMETLTEDMNAQKAQMEGQRALMNDRMIQQQSEINRLQYERNMQHLDNALGR